MSLVPLPEQTVTFIRSITDLFIPASLLHVRSTRGLARSFVFSHLSGAVVALATVAYLASIMPSLDLGLVVVAALAVVFAILPIILKQTGNLSLVTLVSFQSLTITSLVGTFEFGGFGSPFLPWLLVSLMSGLFYQPRRTALVIGLFFADIGLFLVPLLFRERPAVDYADLTTMGWISIAVAMTYMAFMALYYARVIASRAELQLEADRYKAVSTELEQARTAAENLNRTRSMFFSKMGHELRTPLNVIIGYSEILLEDFEDAPVRNEQNLSDLKRINSTGRHLLSLVSDVLDTDTVENGDASIEASSFTLAELRDDLVATGQPLVNRNGNKLVIDCPLPNETITTDAKKLRQMLINLLSNAAKFTRNGIVTLELWVEHSQSDDRLHAAVLDTGIGIAPDALANLFENYVQADRTIQSRFGGTGIGLALTRKFAGILGGTVTVESRLGKGSCFTIDIPAVAKGDSPAEQTEFDKIAVAGIR